jgi:hypothetical protein
MVDDSKVQGSPSDPNGPNLTGSGTESGAEQDDSEQDDSEQEGTEQDTGGQTERPRLQIAWDEFRCLFRGKEPRHRRLHGRLIGILLLSLLVDLVASALLFFAFADSFSDEGDTSIYGLYRAFAWTSSQMLVGGSSYPVKTGAGHFFEVLLQGYAVIVIARARGCSSRHAIGMA